MWSPAGSQAIDGVLWQISVLGLGLELLANPAALCLSHEALGSAVLGLWVGQLASAPGAHPPEVAGVSALLGFQVWEASWSFSFGRPARVLGVCTHPGAFCLCAQAACPLIRARAHQEF